MKSPASRSIFSYIERGSQDSLVLIPGWASDFRIFNHLTLQFNYLIPRDFSPFTFEKNLLALIRENNFKKISLFGWSLGGFLAAEFSSKYAGLIDKLILVSIRKKYKKEELLQIRNRLVKNKKSYLYKFYHQCFSKENKMSWFKENLLSTYCQKLSLGRLLEGLDYLENARINPGALKKVKDIKIIHGECDKIAPFKEAVEVKNIISQAEFISVKNAGHAVFLEEDLSKFIC